MMYCYVGYLYREIMYVRRELLYCSLQQSKLATGGTLRVQTWALVEVSMRTTHQSYILKCALKFQNRV